jgi:hypothetical protein
MGDIVVMFREPSDHLASICVIVNISTETATLTAPIELTGIITECDVWQQSDLAVY